MEIAEKFPELSFEVLVSYPSASYWKGLTEEKAAESLNAGMAYALKYSLMKLVRREALIPHHTVEAYNEVLTELQQQEG